MNTSFGGGVPFDANVLTTYNENLVEKLEKIFISLRNIISFRKPEIKSLI